MLKYRGPSCWLVAALFVAATGCNRMPQSPEEQTIAWLEKGSHWGETLTAPGSSEPREPYEKFLEWLEEGRQIEGISGILTSFLLTNDERVRLSKVTYALCFLGDRRSVPALIEALSTNESDFVRIDAAAALGELGDRRAVRALCESAVKDDGVNVRLNAIGALEKIGDPRAIPHLRKALKDEEDSVVRRAEGVIRRLTTRPAPPDSDRQEND